MANVLPRPPKNYNKFKYDDSQIFYSRQLFDGEAGALPLFLAVNVGYDSEDDNHKSMEAYESGELLFVFKKGVQKRVLIHDSHSRTLSLPLSSPLDFSVRSYPGAGDAVHVADVVKNMKLPVLMSFTKKDNLVFDVDRSPVNHTFFGDLVLVTVYEEAFFYCLSVGPADGKPRGKLQVLPRHLKEVAFSLVDGVIGVRDQQEKLKVVINQLTEACAQYDSDEDPFFQELAIVDKQRQVMTDAEIPDYIEQDTFIDISYRRRDAPDPPGGPPPPPPRVAVEKVKAPVPDTSGKKRKNDANKSKVRSGSTNRNYETLAKLEDAEVHLYDSVGNIEQEVNIMAWQKQALHPLMTSPARQLPPVPSYERAVEEGEQLAPAPPLPSRERRTKNSFGGDSEDGGSAGSLGSVGSTTSDISSLTIEEVCERLQELGLDKYSKKFRKHHIDGILLNKLSDDDLKGDFKMNKVEILRLRTFINEGHIPR